MRSTKTIFSAPRVIPTDCCPHRSAHAYGHTGVRMAGWARTVFATTSGFFRDREFARPRGRANCQLLRRRSGWRAWENVDGVSPSPEGPAGGWKLYGRPDGILLRARIGLTSVIPPSPGPWSCQLGGIDGGATEFGAILPKKKAGGRARIAAKQITMQHVGGTDRTRLSRKVGTKPMREMLDPGQRRCGGEPCSG